MTEEDPGIRDGWLGLSLGWLCMARMVLEATGAPLVRRLGSGAARPRSQLMTYRSLFVVASGQNACFRPARLLLSSRRNNRRKDDHGGELCQVGLTCNMVGMEGGGPGRTTSRHGGWAGGAPEWEGTMIAVAPQRDPLLASPDPLSALGNRHLWSDALGLVLPSLAPTRQI